MNNLWHDGTWYHPSTWASAWRNLFGRQGMVRCIFPGWRAYFRSEFHPSQGRAQASQQWLAQHAEIAVAVQAGTAR